MRMFTERCSDSSKKRRPGFANSFKVILSLFLLNSLLTTGAFGQKGVAPVNPPPNGFNIDGRVVDVKAGIFTGDDWVPQLFTNAGVPASPYNGAAFTGKIFHKVDLQNSTSDDVFTGGSKLNQNPNNDWIWTTSKALGKDDINNSLLFITEDASGDIWVLVSGDRRETNGTSYLDIEFYQAPISLTNTPKQGGFAFHSDGPNFGRTVNDLDVTLSFTGGGNLATISFLKWDADAGAEGGFSYQPVTPPAGSAYVSANNSDVSPTPVPYGAFGSTSYDSLQFIEAAINVTALISGQGLGCGLPFKTVFIKTKSSAAPTAELKDFIEPFQINPCVDATPPGITGTTGTPQNGALGCNPSTSAIEGALGSATATDNCGTPTVTSSDGSVQSSGCSRSQTRTFTATDGCGNTATASRTATWTEDLTAPTINATGTTTTLGCNPSTSAIDGALGTASATDACGGTTVSPPSDGSVQSSGCTRSQTRSWTATDACGNTASTSRTVSWTDDLIPPDISASGDDLTLGCNPSTAAIDGALGTASATDACGDATVTASDGDVLSDGCLRSQTRTFTATDACGNTSTTSRTATWTFDHTPPDISASGNSLELGCNPSTADIDGALGTGSATDACGDATVTPSDGDVQSDGCLRSQTRTFTAIDECGNTSSTSRTATWTEDTTPPDISASGNSLTLGCNPSTAAIDGALGTGSATDACGSTTVTPSDGDVQSDGCLRSQTRTFTAIDACGNTATTSRTATWIFDHTPPDIEATGTPADGVLGCNPTTAAIDAALGSASATDACGDATVTASDGDVQSDGCLRSQTRTFTAIDECGNTSTTSRTATWTFDHTPPDISASGNDLALGCNPSTADIDGALGTASATDACGDATVTPSDGAVQSDGCLRSQTRTFTATDACGNTATTSRTATWTEDTTPPDISASGNSLTLGCNPSTAAIDGALGSGSATDACGGTTVTPSDGSVQSSGCLRSQTRTFTATDGCGNTATTSRTATWTEDTTPPTITCSANKSQDCNTTPSFDEPSTSDGCGGTPTLTSSDSQSGDVYTRTWTATDACGNTATCSQSITIPECGDHIFPTATTCCSFQNGTAQALTQLCFTVKGNGPHNVTNATPGVFFYYATITAPSANFCVNVVQTRSCSDLGYFALVQDQIILWDANCDKVQNVTTNVVANGSSATICVTGATPGAVYVISVKYDTKSIVGTHSNGTSCVYTFVSKIGGVNVSGSTGQITANPNCTVGTVDGGSCPATITTAVSGANQNLSITAYPNPYGSEVNFRFVSAVNGHGTVEVYDVVGRRLAIVFSGRVDANIERTVTYKVPALLRIPLFYRLTVDGKSVVGKVLPGEGVYNEPRPKP